MKLKIGALVHISEIQKSRTVTNHVKLWDKHTSYRYKLQFNRTSCLFLSPLGGGTAYCKFRALLTASSFSNAICNIRPSRSAFTFSLSPSICKYANLYVNYCIYVNHGQVTLSLKYVYMYYSGITLSCIQLYHAVYCM